MPSRGLKKTGPRGDSARRCCFFWQGYFAAPAASFFLDAQKEANGPGPFSWPFGAIHLQPLPCDRAGTVSILRRGTPWGSRRGGAYQEVTLIRPFGPPYPFCPSGTFPPDRGNRPSPLEGEGLRAADSRPYKGNRNPIPHPSRATARVAPTAYPAPGVLVRQSQAQNWNRTNCNFCKPRTQWPGRNLDCHSDFARRKVSVWPKG